MTTTTPRWSVKSNSYGADMEIAGDTLVEAIERDWQRVVHQSGGIGGAPGWHLDEVIAEYRDGILGGKGGVEVRITHRSLDMEARGPSGSPRVTRVWIHAKPADLPEPHTFAGPNPATPSRPYYPERKRRAA